MVRILDVRLYHQPAGIRKFSRSGRSDAFIDGGYRSDCRGHFEPVMDHFGYPVTLGDYQPPFVIGPPALMPPLLRAAGAAWF